MLEQPEIMNICYKILWHRVFAEIPNDQYVG